MAKLVNDLVYFDGNLYITADFPHIMINRKGSVEPIFQKKEVAIYKARVKNNVLFFFSSSTILRLDREAVIDLFQVSMEAFPKQEEDVGYISDVQIISENEALCLTPTRENLQSEISAAQC